MGWPAYERPEEEAVKDEKIAPFPYMIGGSYTTRQADLDAEVGVEAKGCDFIS